MIFHTRSENRSYELGGYPLESLNKDMAIVVLESARPQIESPAYNTEPVGPLAKALRQYLDIFIDNADSETAEQKTPVPDDLHRKMIDIKGYSYFMNASQVGYAVYYAMPVPNDLGRQPVNRKADMAATADMETPKQARERKIRGGDIPSQYIPTPSVEKA